MIKSDERIGYVSTVALSAGWEDAGASKSKAAGKCRKSPSQAAVRLTSLPPGAAYKLSQHIPGDTITGAAINAAADEQTWFVRDLLANAVYHARPTPESWCTTTAMA